MQLIPVTGGSNVRFTLTIRTGVLPIREGTNIRFQLRIVDCPETTITEGSNIRFTFRATSVERSITEGSNIRFTFRATSVERSITEGSNIRFVLSFSTEPPPLPPSSFWITEPGESIPPWITEGG